MDINDIILNLEDSATELKGWLLVGGYNDASVCVEEAVAYEYASDMLEDDRELPNRYKRELKQIQALRDSGRTDIRSDMDILADTWRRDGRCPWGDYQQITPADAVVDSIADMLKKYKLSNSKILSILLDSSTVLINGGSRCLLDEMCEISDSLKEVVESLEGEE